MPRHRSDHHLAAAAAPSHDERSSENGDLSERARGKRPRIASPANFPIPTPSPRPTAQQLLSPAPPSLPTVGGPACATPIPSVRRSTRRKGPPQTGAPGSTGEGEVVGPSGKIPRKDAREEERASRREQKAQERVLRAKRKGPTAWQRRKEPKVDPDGPKPPLLGATSITSIHLKQVVYAMNAAVQRGDVVAAGHALEVLIPKGAEMISRDADFDGVAMLACRGALELLRSDRAHLNLCSRVFNIMKLMCSGEEKRRLELDHAMLLCSHDKPSEAATLCKAASLEVQDTDAEALYSGYVGLIEAAIWEAHTRTVHDATARLHAAEAIAYLKRAVGSTTIPPEPAFLTRLIQLSQATRGPAHALAEVTKVLANHPHHGPTLQLACRALRVVESDVSDQALNLLRALVRVDPTNSELGEAVHAVVKGNIGQSTESAPTSEAGKAQEAGEVSGAGTVRGRRLQLVLGSSSSEGLQYEEIAIEHAAALIEYHDPAAQLETVPLWEQLCEVLEIVPRRFVPTLCPTAKDLPCWSSRLSWWRIAYFTPTAGVLSGPSASGPSAEENLMQTLLKHKSKCAGLIYGDDVAALFC